MGTSMDIITTVKCVSSVELPWPVERVLFPMMTKILVKSRFRIVE